MKMTNEFAELVKKNSKTTIQILESAEAKEFFDIHKNIMSSEIPQDIKAGFARLSSWCTSHNDLWLRVEDIKDYLNKEVNNHGK